MNKYFWLLVPLLVSLPVAIVVELPPLPESGSFLSFLPSWSIPTLVAYFCFATTYNLSSAWYGKYNDLLLNRFVPGFFGGQLVFVLLLIGYFQPLLALSSAMSAVMGYIFYRERISEKFSS